MHVTIIIIGESVNAPLQKRHSLCCVVSASAQSDTATPVVSLWSCNHRCLCETGTGGPEGGGEGEAEGSGGGGWQVGLWYSGEMAKLSLQRGAVAVQVQRLQDGLSEVLHTGTHYTTQCCH